MVAYMGQRTEMLIRNADQIVDDCGGDIYGADPAVFQRWKGIMNRASELSAALSKYKPGEGV